MENIELLLKEILLEIRELKLEVRELKLGAAKNVKEVKKVSKVKEVEVSFEKEDKKDLIFEYQKSECIQEIEDYLASKNIKVKTKKKDTILYSDNLSKLANFIGKNYENVKEFIHKLKVDNNKAQGFTMNLKDFSPKKISDINQLAKWLYDIGFLEKYVYKNSPNFLLYAKLNRNPKAINFLLGGWMEIYIRNVVLKILSEIGLDGCYIKNYQISLPDEKDFELDLVFKVGDDFYWIETKTGDYQSYINKYANFYKLIGINKENAFLVLSDMSEEGAKTLSDMYEINTLRLQDFEREFKKRVGVLDED
ncbi:MAG: hypothetical protein ABGX23_01815 [Nautiliaceae bacterium]